MRVWRAVLLALAVEAVVLACGSKRAPSLADQPAPDKGSAGADAGLDLGDASVVPAGPCGAQSIPATTNPPNLAFVIDHSGSMGDDFAGTGLSKYENARIALAHVLRAIGHRVNYSASVFPGLDGATGCEPGDELMKMGPGDPPSYAAAKENGPRLADLLGRLSIAGVTGGTPTAPTLTKELGILSKLKGATYVVLITDGAPDCNAALQCKASGCIPNIEGLTAGGMNCTASVNCCLPSGQDPQANWSCVDSQASIDAVQALADAGIDTFIVGMPGSEAYEDLLNSMAVAGGTARDDTTKYYPVTDTDALDKSLTSIAASIAISCDIPLDYDPPDRDFVNVYFDGKLVDYDARDGWEWSSDGHVSIRGAACDQLSTGDVLEVQILAGCKTVVK